MVIIYRTNLCFL